MNISSVYINALLADATYALGNQRYKNVTGIDLMGILSERMTPELAKYISENFKVKDHFESDDIFVDATVWEHVNSGELFLSMQGTKSFGDFVTDLDLSIGTGIPSDQVVDWLRISTPVGEMATHTNESLRER